MAPKNVDVSFHGNDLQRIAQAMLAASPHLTNHERLFTMIHIVTELCDHLGVNLSDRINELPSTQKFPMPTGGFGQG